MAPFIAPLKLGCELPRSFLEYVLLLYQEYPEREEDEMTRPSLSRESSLRLPLFGQHNSRRAVTIQGMAPEDVFDFWRDLSNLKLFMKGISSEWAGAIVEEEAGRMISWRSVTDVALQMTGTVWFTPSPRNEGTVVCLVMDYNMPGGKIVEFIAQMEGEEPDLLAQVNLHRLKSYLETGEVPTVEGQSSGREQRSNDSMMH